jgi:hypothetical protein
MGKQEIKNNSTSIIKWLLNKDLRFEVQVFFQKT